MTEFNQGSKNIVFGAGQLGLAVMDTLTKDGKQVTVVNRSGVVQEPLPDGVSIRQADLADADSVTRVTNGAEVVFLCAAPPYADWPGKFPPMIQSVIEGVSRTEAKLVFGDNLYMYGPTGGKPIREDMPYAASGPKGRTRAQVATMLLDAHKAGKLPVTIGRASDFFGPRVTGSAMGERVFSAALAGDTVDVLGNIHLPHTYTYIRDFANALVTLSAHEQAYGEAWHVPNAKTMTTQQWLDMIGEQVGHPLKIRSAGKWMLTALGLFNPQIREMKEMLYEFDESYIVDDTKFEQAFDSQPTAPNIAIQETLDWYRKHTMQ